MKIKAIAVLLFSALLVIQAAAVFSNHIFLTYANSGRKIDLFTQKFPFNGEGLNQSSDSFQPQEKVILYALVTYNDAPVANKYVAFQVDGPKPEPTIDPIRIIGTAPTNESGIAKFSFRIPWPDKNAERIILGEWSAIATVDIAEVVVSDTLTFKVDWGVKINGITILNDKLVPQTTFLRQSIIIFNLTVENTGLTPKTATIAIDGYDAVNYPIIHIELGGLLLQPGESQIQASSQIPIYARIGEANIHTAAYTAPPSEGGEPYGPALNTTFTIITRDIAVTSISVSKAIAKIGDTIEISVTVKNKGNQTESFFVSTFYNQTLIQKKYVNSLEPDNELKVQFFWSTNNVPEGNYFITAVADPVEGEIEVRDNTLTDGTVQILTQLPQIIHDVAVTALYAQPLEVVVGEPIQITVQVKNLGTEPESFNVTLFYDNFPMVTLTSGFLAPGASGSLTYVWDTSSVMEGNYTIKAYITPVEGEQNTSNNWFSDGAVWIKAPSVPVKKHDVAVTALNISKRSVYRGETLNVAVCIANFGDFSETFGVSVYANMTIIWSYTVEGLQANSSKVLSFSWDTSNINIGGYTIWAKAEYVAGETNIENNVYMNGTVVIQSPPIYYVHDVAVTSIQPASYSVLAGQKLNVLVTVKNYGNATESFNVTLYYDSKTIQELPVYLLQPMAEKTINFEWDTSNVENGTYILRAYAEPVSGETNTANNILVDGAVSVLTPPPTTVRDVEIIWLMAEPSEVTVGDNVTIKVTVLNLGSLPESFNVTVYYDSKIIGTLPVVSLTPYTAREITLTWNTSSVTPGVYTLSANATILEGEVDTLNNHFTDGSITIKPAFAPSYLTILAPFLIGLAVFLAIILFYYVRRKRKAVKPTPQFIIVSRPHI